MVIKNFNTTRSSTTCRQTRIASWKQEYQQHQQHQQPDHQEHVDNLTDKDRLVTNSCMDNGLFSHHLRLVWRRFLIKYAHHQCDQKSFISFFIVWRRFLIKYVIAHHRCGYMNIMFANIVMIKLYHDNAYIEPWGVSGWRLFPPPKIYNMTNIASVKQCINIWFNLNWYDIMSLPTPLPALHW